MIRSAGTPIFSMASDALNIPSNAFKAEESNESKAECSRQTDPDRLDHTISLLCTIVVSNDRRDTIVQTEYRHEEEALKLEVYTEYSSCS